MYRGVERGEFDAGFERELAAAVATPWFADSALPTPPMAPVSAGERALLLFDPVPAWRQVRVPVLAIWGDRDAHLPASRSRALVAAALAQAPGEAVELQVLDGADHGFFRVPAADSAWDFPRVDPRAERLLVNWIIQQRRRCLQG